MIRRIIEVIKNLFKKVNYIFFVGASDILPEPLSKEEELKCLKEFEQGSIDAKNKLIEHNLRLVAHIAKKYADEKNLEDLISIGTIGLIKGINTFNAEKNSRLSAYIGCH